MMPAANGITERFLARWADQPPDRLRDLAGQVGRPLSFGSRFLTRPAFLEAEEARRVAADSSALLDLLFTLPGRLFGGDLTAMAAAVGLAPVQAEAVVRTAAEHPVRLARADLYHDGEGFRLLEYNVSSALGGWDISILNRCLLRDPGLASFAGEEGLTFPDTVAAFAGVILAECAGLDCPSRPVVALADWPSSYPTFGPSLDSMARSLEPFGLEAYGCHAGQLTTRNGHLYLGGRHVDAVYRFIPLSDLLDGPDAPAVAEPMIAAAERGTAHMITGFSAGLFASKGCLALLSDDGHREIFSPAERDLIDRFIPWTRTLRPGPAQVGGQRVDLVDYVLDSQADLILKPAQLYGGAGVLPGWRVSHRAWAKAVRAGLGGRVVVQRRVRPATERFPDPAAPGGASEQALNWGVIIAGPGYAGTVVRGMPGSDVGVINLSNGAGATGAFHVMTPPAEASD
ncbi:MAG TPA: hypothetical protein VGG25_21575 [Streptosporangiaceae bacterium]|jgi:hypothetical protein